MPVQLHRPSWTSLVQPLPTRSSSAPPGLFVCLSVVGYSPNARTDSNEIWHACSRGGCVVCFLPKTRIRNSVSMETAKNRFFGRQWQLRAPFSLQQRRKSKKTLLSPSRNIISFQTSPLSSFYSENCKSLRDLTEKQPISASEHQKMKLSPLASKL